MDVGLAWKEAPEAGMRQAAWVLGEEYRQSKAGLLLVSMKGYRKAGAGALKGSVRLRASHPGDGQRLQEKPLSRCSSDDVDRILQY